jgi:acyl carrier protein
MQNSQLAATIEQSYSLTTNTDEPHDAIDSRNVINVIHQKFQQNQSQHLDLISKIIDRQSFSLEHYQGRKELPIALQNLDKIIQLLENNLAYTNSHHANYLQNQLALLQGSIVTDLPEEVSTTDRSKRTLINAATNNSTPIVSNSTGTVAATDLSTPVVQQSAEIDLTAVNNSPIPSAPGLMGIVISSTIDRPIPAVQKQAKIDLAPTTENLQSNGKAQKAELDPVIVPPSEQVVDAAKNLQSNGKAQKAELDPVIVPPSDRVVNSINIAEIATTLLKVVSEKTGYPVEMLDLTMDLEADMGIDSIKQVEIISGMHDAYPQIELDAETLGETLGELRTLDQIVDYIQQVVCAAPLAAVINSSSVDGITRQSVKKNS